MKQQPKQYYGVRKTGLLEAKIFTNWDDVATYIAVWVGELL